jgi:hypothetical protein
MTEPIYDPSNPDAFTGYRHDLEDRDYLERTAVPFNVTRADYGAPTVVEEPWNLIRTENQGGMGSCQGHAASTVAELCRGIAEGGRPILDPADQFSPIFAYLESQRFDGISGDRGSTIGGGLKTNSEVGCCPLSACPYPSPVRYPGRGYITDAHRQAAAPFKIKSHVWLSKSGYQAWADFLGANIGGINMGIPWNGSWKTGRVIESVSGSGGGWHAVAVLFLSPRKDAQGRHYVWMNNSHSERYGYRGWVEIAPKGIDQICAIRGVSACGMSDLTTPTPREIDWVKRSIHNF